MATGSTPARLASPSSFKATGFLCCGFCNPMFVGLKSHWGMCNDSRRSIDTSETGNKHNNGQNVCQQKLHILRGISGSGGAGPKNSFVFAANEISERKRRGEMRAGLRHAWQPVSGRLRNLLSARRQFRQDSIAARRDHHLHFGIIGLIPGTASMRGTPSFQFADTFNGFTPRRRRGLMGSGER